MPKNTFFNLSKDKMDKIIDVSVDEFAEYSYLNASINRIVERAEIAKGSFYQYFEDKKDLYKYIINECLKKKLMYLNDTIENLSETDFFFVLKKLYLAEVKFFIELPKYSIMALDFKKNRDIEWKNEILDNTSSDHNIVEKLLLKAIGNGDIDESIDTRTVTFFIISLSLSILEYFIYEANSDEEEVNKFIDNILVILKSGIKTKKKYIRNVEDRFY